MRLTLIVSHPRITRRIDAIHQPTRQGAAGGWPFSAPADPSVDTHAPVHPKRFKERRTGTPDDDDAASQKALVILRRDDTR